MKIFKFGGASVKDAAGVKNVAQILRSYESEKLLVVISAMAKTTNLLEKLVSAYVSKQDENTKHVFQELIAFHFAICDELFADKQHPIFNELDNLFLEIDCLIEKDSVRDDFDFVYDQLVSYGELISTKIVSAFLLKEGIKNKWVDARNFIFTDSNYREAGINWTETERIVAGKLKPFAEKSMVITQGFIGKNRENATTTLGREGSDYSAAIFAWCLDAESVTIWKDVAGVMNADPKKMPEAVKINELSFTQAIELAYYGASVIHPKTIQPLQSKSIPLYVKSFVNPAESGTIVGLSNESLQSVTCFIFKEKQCLLSLKTKDFSFVAENNLQEIFRILALHKLRVNVMQNSAISFNAVVDCDSRKLEKMKADLSLHFEVQLVSDLDLLTVYNPSSNEVSLPVNESKRYLQQKGERALHIVYQSK
jgi:aspartate kinase